MKVFLEEIENNKVARYLKKDNEDVLNVNLDDIDGDITVGKWYTLTSKGNGRFQAVVDTIESGKRKKRAQSLRERLKNK